MFAMQQFLIAKPRIKPNVLNAKPIIPYIIIFVISKYRIVTLKRALFVLNAYLDMILVEARAQNQLQLTTAYYLIT